MGREVRRVKPGWIHPSDAYLYDGATYHDRVAERLEELAEFPDQDFPPYRLEEFSPIPPDPIPDDWGWAFYESTSNGSPLSPTFATPEELARWMIDDYGWPSTAEQIVSQMRRGKGF